MVQAETGRTWNDAAMEPIVGIDVINYFTKHAAEFLAPRKVAPDGPAGAAKRLRLAFRPYPLVGLITPWNGRIGNPILDVVGALLAGAAVLSKPSEFTPLSWAEAVRGWREDVGAPPILACVTGDGTTGAPWWTRSTWSCSPARPARAAGSPPRPGSGSSPAASNSAGRTP
jgi:acyl-CoA reductase-like NAD-dependent aldehyde dehydrogenase